MFISIIWGSGSDCGSKDDSWSCWTGCAC
jgi:hypothetical protein